MIRLAQFCKGIGVAGRHLARVGNGRVQVAQQAVLQAVNPSMHRQGLASLPGVADNRGVTHVEDLLDDIQLTKPVQPLRQLRQGRQAALVFLPHEPVSPSLLALFSSGAAPKSRTSGRLPGL